MSVFRQFRRRENMRLFIAVRFPENITAALEDAQKDLKRQGLKGNFSRVQNLHLTLAFLGETDDAAFVKAAMDAVGFENIDIKLKGAGKFGDLYWAGLEENRLLSDYVKRLRGELSARGIWFDPKPFRPHITLVRKGRAQGNVKVNVRESAFSAAAVSLMKSERIDGKLVYTQIYSVNSPEMTKTRNTD